jgi:hypothetical protein
MAITVSVLNTPISLEPINAPLWFRINSTSSGLTDFKYVFRPEYRIEPFTGGYTTLGTYRIPPRPVNGDGLFSPHRSLKSFIQTNIDPYVSTTTLSAEASSLISYKLNYGFDFNPNKVFTDTINVSGNMGLTFSTIHEFLVGDIITINKDNKSFNPQYDGTCSVASVPNSYSIKTDKVFSTTLLANESGVITNQFRITGSSSEFFTFNGTRQYNERTKDFRQYIIGTVSAGTAGKFLTNYDKDISKPVRLDDYETLSVILPSSPLNPYYVSVNTYRSDNSLIGTYGLTYSAANSYRKVDIGVGPMNLINLGIPFVNSNTGTNIVSHYDIHIKRLQFGFPTSVSEFRKYRIDNTCTNYEKQRVVFLNRLGGYDYFNFTLDSKKTLSITRTEYEKMLNWNYNIGDRGKTILAQKAETKMTINSNWITEYDSLWLEELLTSPEVFILPNTNVVYQNQGPIYLTNEGPNYFSISTTDLPAGSYNIQFDAILKDDLLIDAIDLTSLDVVPLGTGTLHYAKKLTTTGGLVFTNIVNYDDDIIINNLVITRTTGDKLPIIITDNSYEVKTALRNQMFNLVLNYKFGYDLNLQNE